LYNTRASFEEPGQGYPEPASIYEESDESEEAKDVCKDHSEWKDVISAYPYEKRG
jgi:hypothetical protein